MAMDNFILLPFFYGALWFLLPGQRSSNGHHRCVTPLYRVPMGSFYCAMLKLTQRRKGAKKQSFIT